LSVAAQTVDAVQIDANGMKAAADGKVASGDICIKDAGYVQYPTASNSTKGWGLR
jgi:hypothetical protein